MAFYDDVNNGLNDAQKRALTEGYIERGYSLSNQPDPNQGPMYDNDKFQKDLENLKEQKQADQQTDQPAAGPLDFDIDEAASQTSDIEPERETTDDSKINSDLLEAVVDAMPNAERNKHSELYEYLQYKYQDEQHAAEEKRIADILGIDPKMIFNNRELYQDMAVAAAKAEKMAKLKNLYKDDGTIDTEKIYKNIPGFEWILKNQGPMAAAMAMANMDGISKINEVYEEGWDQFAGSIAAGAKRGALQSERNMIGAAAFNAVRHLSEKEQKRIKEIDAELAEQYEMSYSNVYDVTGGMLGEAASQGSLFLYNIIGKGAALAAGTAATIYAGPATGVAVGKVAGTAGEIASIVMMSEEMAGAHYLENLEKLNKNGMPMYTPKEAAVLSGIQGGLEGVIENYTIGKYLTGVFSGGKKQLTEYITKSMLAGESEKAMKDGLLKLVRGAIKDVGLTAVVGDKKLMGKIAKRELLPMAKKTASNAGETLIAASGEIYEEMEQQLSSMVTENIFQAITKGKDAEYYSFEEIAGETLAAGIMAISATGGFFLAGMPIKTVMNTKRAGQIRSDINNYIHSKYFKDGVENSHRLNTIDKVQEAIADGAIEELQKAAPDVAEAILDKKNEEMDITTTMVDIKALNQKENGKELLKKLGETLGVDQSEIQDHLRDEDSGMMAVKTSKLMLMQRDTNFNEALKGNIAHNLDALTDNRAQAQFKALQEQVKMLRDLGKINEDEVAKVIAENFKTDDEKLLAEMILGTSGNNVQSGIAKLKKDIQAEMDELLQVEIGKLMDEAARGTTWIPNNDRDDVGAVKRVSMNYEWYKKWFKDNPKKKWSLNEARYLAEEAINGHDPYGVGFYYGINAEGQAEIDKIKDQVNDRRAKLDLLNNEEFKNKINILTINNIMDTAQLSDEAKKIFVETANKFKSKHNADLSAAYIANAISMLAYLDARVKARQAAGLSDWTLEDQLKKVGFDIFGENDSIENNGQQSLYQAMFGTEVNEQMAAVRAQYEGTDQWMKAPNGADTNLTEEQWLVVRTDNFKNWFGDWENDPENASKVVDENGEPKVMYHGTLNYGFTEFRTNKIDSNFGSHFGTLEQASEFTDDDEQIYGVFLNIRKPFMAAYDYFGMGAYGPASDIAKMAMTIDTEQAYALTKEIEDEYPFVTSRNEDDLAKGFADYLFSSDYEEFEQSDKVNRIYREMLKLGGYDGVQYENELEGLDGENHISLVIQDPTNVKSATDNNGNFDPNDPNIYYQIMGEKGAAALDAAQEVTTRLDDLETAKFMEEFGNDPHHIKLATGWERGADGKWRYEVMDPKFNVAFGDMLSSSKTTEYKSIADFIEGGMDSELLKAYPQLADWKVRLNRRLKSSAGYTITENKTIDIGLARGRDIWNRAVGKYMADGPVMTMIHELQHAIQDIEGFSPGTDDAKYRDKKLPDNLKQANLNRFMGKSAMCEELRKKGIIGNGDISLQQLQFYLDDLKKIADEYRANKDVLKANKIEQWLADNAALHPYDIETAIMKYARAAGETEARNVEIRYIMTAEEKLNSLLTDTQDIAPEEIRILNELGQEVKGSTDKINTFYQTAYHGSPHKFDKFDLGAIGTGEGAQVHGWGLYFAQNKDVSQMYRDVLSRGKTKTIKFTIAGQNYTIDNRGISVESGELPDGVKALKIAFSGIFDAYSFERNADRSLMSWVNDWIDRIKYDFENGYISGEKYNAENKEKIRKALSTPKHDATQEEIDNVWNVFYKWARIAQNDLKYNEQINIYLEAEKEIVQLLGERKGNAFIKKLRKLYVSVANVIHYIEAFENRKIALKWLESLKNDDLSTIKAEDPGSLFEVDIPEESVMLDEQKPLKDQPYAVKKAVEALQEKARTEYHYEFTDEGEVELYYGDKYINTFFDTSDVVRYMESIGDVALHSIKRINEDSKGREIYNSLGLDTGTGKTASMLLNKYGIEGITYDGYRDGRCFVVFNDEAVDIIAINNQAVNSQPVQKSLFQKGTKTLYQKGDLGKAAKKQMDKVKDKKEKPEKNKFKYRKEAQFFVMQQAGVIGPDSIIQSVDDITNYQVAILNATDDQYAADFTKEDAKQAEYDGEITLYSPNRYISQVGYFVTPSKQLALSMSDNGKVATKKVNLRDVAWKNVTEGLYVPHNKTTSTTEPLEKGYRDDEYSEGELKAAREAINNETPYFDRLGPREKEVCSDYLNNTENGRRLLELLLDPERRSTSWANVVFKSILVQKALPILLEGKDPDFYSEWDNDNDEVQGMRKAIKDGGLQGLKNYLARTTLLSDSMKPVNSIPASFLNCNSSKGCAAFCYTTRRRGAMPTTICKQEMINFFIVNFPEEAADMAALQYSATPEGQSGMTLRILDRGDLNEEWLPWINAIGKRYTFNRVKNKKEPIILQIFSKRGEILEKINPMHVRLLSIDNTNRELMDKHPNLPVAFVWQGPQDNEFLNTRFKEQFDRCGGVILPVELGGAPLAERLIAQLPKWTQGRDCLINKGKKVIGTREQVAGIQDVRSDKVKVAPNQYWNCTMCDEMGCGCFYNNSYKDKHSTKGQIAFRLAALSDDIYNKGIDAVLNSDQFSDFDDTVAEFISIYEDLFAEQEKMLGVELDEFTKKHILRKMVAKLPRRERLADTRGEEGIGDGFSQSVRRTGESGSTVEEQPTGRSLNQVTPLFQSDRVDTHQGVKGATEYRDMDNKGSFGDIMIRMFESADQSTFVHELGHVYLLEMQEIAMANGDSQEAKDLETVRKWASWKAGQIDEYKGTASYAEFAELDQAIREATKNGSAMYNGEMQSLAELKDRWIQERFARGFEMYLQEGQAPTPTLKRTFRRFKQWLVKIYNTLTGAGAKPTDEVKAVMARAFATQETIDATAELNRINNLDVLDDIATEGVLKTHEEWKDEAREEAKERMLSKLLKVYKKDIKDKVDAFEKAKREEITQQLKDQYPCYSVDEMIAEGLPKADALELYGFTDTKLYTAEQLYSQEKRRAGQGELLDLKDAVDRRVKAEVKAFKEQMPTTAQLQEMAESELASTKAADVVALEAEILARREERYKAAGAKLMTAFDEVDKALEGDDIAKLERKILELKYANRWREAELKLISEMEIAAAKAKAEDKLNAAKEKLKEERANADTTIKDLKKTAEWNAAEQDVVNDVERAKHNRDKAKLRGANKRFDNLKEQYDKLKEMTLENVDWLRGVRDAAKGRSKLLREQAQNDIKFLPVHEAISIGLWNRKQQKAAAEAYAAAVDGQKLKAQGKTQEAQAAWDKAYQAKIQQSYYAAMTNAANKASQEVNKALNAIQKHRRSLSKQGSVKLDAQARYYFDHLLYLYGFNTVDARKPAELDGFATFWKDLTDDVDDEVTLDPAFIAIVEDNKQQDKYNKLNMEQFREIVKILNVIYTLGRNKNMLLTMDISIEQVREECMQAFRGNVGKAIAEKRFDTPSALAEYVGEYEISLLRPELMLEIAGGSGEGFHKYIYMILQKATENEAIAREDEAKAYKELVERFYSAEERRDFDKAIDGVKLPDGTELTKNMLLAMALNWGNKTNKARLYTCLYADEYGNLPNAEQAASDTQEYFKAYMTENDWRFVQAVWDHLNTFGDKVSAVVEKINGVPMKRVEAEGFDIMTADNKIVHLEGGYYPLVANPRKDSTVNEQQEIENAAVGRQSLGSGMGSTKDRAQSLNVNRPLLLDLNVISRHINQQIHIANMRLAARDAYKVLNDPVIKQELQLTWGHKGYKALNDWILDCWKPAPGPTNVMERMAAMIRGNSVGAIMGYRVGTGVLNFANIVPMVNEIGFMNAMSAMLSYVTNPKEIRHFVLNDSVIMRNRADNLDTDLSHIQETAFGNDGRITNAINRYANWFIAETDMICSIPLYYWKYQNTLNNAIKAGAKAQDAAEQAHAAATKAVRNVFGSTDMVDRSSVQRSKSEFVKLFIPFFTFSNTMYNAVAKDFYKASKGGTNEAEYSDEGKLINIDYDRGDLKGRYTRAVQSAFMLFVMMPLVETMIRAAIDKATGSGDDKDEDIETILAGLGKEWAKNSVNSASGGLYGINLGINAVVRLLEGGYATGRGSTGVIGGAAERAERLVGSISKLVEGKGSYIDVGRNLARVGNTFYGTPDTLSDTLFNAAQFIDDYDRYNDMDAWREFIAKSIFDRKLKAKK